MLKYPFACLFVLEPGIFNQNCLGEKCARSLDLPPSHNHLPQTQSKFLSTKDRDDKHSVTYRWADWMCFQSPVLYKTVIHIKMEKMQWNYFKKESGCSCAGGTGRFAIILRVQSSAIVEKRLSEHLSTIESSLMDRLLLAESSWEHAHNMTSDLKSDLIDVNGRTRVRLSAGSYQDHVNWYCSLQTSNKTRHCTKTQSWRYKTTVVIKRHQQNTKRINK